jgi:hypothetical protein
MANSLHRNLKVGDKVVLDGPVDAVIDSEMFGCMSFTRGTAIGVTINGQSMRADGFDIDAQATLQRFAKENGWLDENGQLKPQS